MVLRKEILLLFGSILFLCITNNVYAQISEHSFDKGVDISRSWNKYVTVPNMHTSYIL